MFINEFGCRDDPTFVLLAPMMVSGTDLHHLINPHFEGDYHIIAPDQGGHGQAGGYHSADAVKNTNATFGWGAKSGREYLELEPRMTLVSETSYNEEMKKYTIRGKLFAIIGKNMNNRLAVFKW